MVDWTSPHALNIQADAFQKLNHALAGLYFWEFLTSLDFDWAFLSGKKKLHWPMIPYFLNRYLLLFALIGVLIALDTTQEINCQSLYIFNQLAGNAAVGLASINLALRTMALWGHSLYIVVPLILVILGHWTLILQGVLLKAAWVDGTGCVITHTNNTVLAATFIYSMCLDLVVLLLSGSKLIRHRTNSQLTTLLFKDGLIYFIVAFVSNLIATIFMCLNLSSIMSVIFNVPAAIASTIVACRAVRRLSNWASTGVHVYSGSRSAPYIRSNRGPTITTTRSKPDNLEHGVHIQMETVTEMVSDMTPRGYEDSAVESDFKDYVEHKSVPL